MPMLNRTKNRITAFFLVILFAFNSSLCLAQPDVDSLKNLLYNAGNEKKKILIQTQLAAKYAPAKMDTALAYCYAALRLAKTINDDSLQGVCYKCLMSAYYYKAYFEDSALYFIPFFKQAVCNHNNYQLEYEGYLAIAEIYLKKYDWPNSTIYFQLAMQAAEKTNKPDIKGWAMYRLADMYRKSGSCPDAIPINEQLIADGKKYNLPVSVYNGYRGIAICYDIQQQYDSAEKYFSLALEVALQTNSQKRIATAYTNVGVVTWHTKSYIESIAASLKAVEILASLNDEQIISAYQNLCCVYRDMGKLDSAAIYCKLGLDEATKRNQVFSMSILNGISSDVYLKQGDYKFAYEHLVKAKNFNDSLHTAKHTIAVKELEEKYKNKENKLEIDMLSKENELKALLIKKREFDLLNAELDADQQKEMTALIAMEIKNKETQLQQAHSQSTLKEKEKTEVVNQLAAEQEGRNRERYFAFIIFGLLLISIGSAYYIFRQRRKLKLLTEKHEAVMNERRRISADMHDDLGSDLSKIALLSEVLKHNAGKNGTGEQLNKISELAQDALLRIEEIIWSLNPRNDDLKKLIAYMRQKIAEQFENTAIECMISMPDVIPEFIISGEQRRNIFLAVNEACHNIVKHAQATKVSICFTCIDNWFKIKINDNGKGIEHAFLNPMHENRGYGGNGLLNMKERVAASGGTFQIQNHEGTTINISLPLPA